MQRVILSARILLVVWLAAVASTAGAATFVVTNVADSGPGTLRQAITDANLDVGLTTIEFDISGAGPHVIAPVSALPAITKSDVTLDGYTQPGSSSNTLAEGSDADLRIILDGSSMSASALVLAGDRSLIRGLVVRDWNWGFGAIQVTGFDCIVEGNFIGTDVTGETAVPNAVGVASFTATGLRIGGLLPASRNVISGNSTSGIIFLNGGGNLTVQGNYIGVNAQGTLALGNDAFGIQVAGQNDSLVGGSLPGASNLISGNGAAGIDINNGVRITIQGNLIGTDVKGTDAIPNLIGIDWFQSEDAQIGGANLGEGNIIAFNENRGIGTAGNATGVGNTISGNSIFDNVHSLGNTSLGIDLEGDGQEINDACDTDGGTNGLQNFPVIDSAQSDASGSLVGGILDSTPGTLQRIEFFANLACDPSGFGEGRTYLGATTVATDAGTCLASFNVSLPAIPLGQFVTATATGSDGSTSEFSACAEVTSLAVPVPAFHGFYARALLAVCMVAWIAWQTRRRGPGAAARSRLRRGRATTR